MKIGNIMAKLKYFIKKFEFLKVYNSPFKRIKPKFYFGKIAISVPVFYPRVWKPYSRKEAIIKAKEEHTNYMKDWSFEKKYNYYIKCQHAVPKRVGFDFCGLYWKTKFDEYRFEFSPVWSFVFFGWQIAVTWVAPVDVSRFWECYLTYHYGTDKNKTTKERIKQARKINPCIWTSHYQGKEETVDYWDRILK